jgi:cobaltochelatase CobS
MQTTASPKVLSLSSKAQSQVLLDEIEALEKTLALKRGALSNSKKLTVPVSVRDLLKIDSGMILEKNVLPPTHGAALMPDYLFRPALTRDVLMFWLLKKRSCMLTGHKGTGKTTLIEQLHRRLNIDLLVYAGNVDTEVQDLFGQLVPNEDGTLSWSDGPVTKAARNGYSVLIDEFNALKPGVQIALNGIAQDGGAFSPPGSSEQFLPAEGFRLFCTINPKGANDHIYQGRKEIDGALKERFFWINVDYATEAEEQEIVENAWASASGHVGEVEKVLCKHIVDVAREVRQRSEMTGPDAIPEIISTRVMANWAIYWFNYGRIERKPGSPKTLGAVHVGLKKALTDGCRPEVAKAIHKIVEKYTSDPYDLTLNAS